MIHPEPHPSAGQTVQLKTGNDQVVDYRLEDWWDRVAGGSWGSSQVPAAFDYALRVDAANLPWDDEVVYGKIDGSGCLVHVSELAS